MMLQIAKLLVMIGIFLILLGGIIFLFNRIPYLGKLPGDIYIKRDNFVFYFPLATCIILSILFSLVLTFVFRRWR